MMLAYAMARAGAEVTYLTNVAPIFDGDFDIFQETSPITKIVGPGFEAPQGYVADWVVVIPTGSFDDRFYDAALNQAKAWKARVALLSFETPNWYNGQSPFPRSPLPTESWRRVVASGGLVVTIAEEGVAPAKLYYGASRDGEDLRFGAWHPPVNDLASASDPVTSAALHADAAGRKRIVSFVRTEDLHKGAHDLLALPPNTFDGHILALVFGRGVNDAYVAALRRHFASARDFAIELHSQISDVDKFALLAQARLLLFPSYFEGYGYPPVEAAWMGVPSVAYDLPVLRETVGDAATYVTPGDTAGFAAAIRQSLTERPTGDAVRHAMRILPDTQTAGQKFLGLLATAGSLLPPIGGQPPALPIAPQTALLRSDPLQYLVASYSDAVQLGDLRAHAHIGPLGPVVTVTGRARKGLESDRLRFVMAGVAFSDVRLVDDAGQGMRFSTTGELELLPDGSASKCTILTLRRGGAQTNRVTIPVEIGPELLCLRGMIRPAHVPAADSTDGDVHLLVAPATLAQDPVLALTLSEVSETLLGLDLPTRLLLANGSGDERLMLEEDFLPLADTVETCSPEIALAKALAALASGRRVVAPAAEAELLGGLAPVVALARLRPEGATQDLVVLGKTGPATKTVVTAFPDQMVARRSLATQVRTCVLVLLADAPIVSVAPEVLHLLKALERRNGALRVVMSRRLCTLPDRTQIRFGYAGLVEVLDEAELVAALASAETCAGLQVSSAPDAVGAALLSFIANTSLTVVASDPDAESKLNRALGARAPADSKIAACIRAVFPPNRTPSPLTSVAIGGAAALSAFRKPVTQASLPNLKVGEVISFSLPSLGHETALVSGFNTVNARGAVMDRMISVIGFDWQAEVPDRSIDLELLLSAHPSANAGPEAASDPEFLISLNGTELGTLTLSAKGVQRHSLSVPASAWSHEISQNLLLVRKGSASDIKKLKVVSLVSIAASVPRSPELDWTSFDIATKSMAPLRLVEHFEPQVFFHKGAAIGFAALGRGWAKPEPTGIWNGERSAVITFDPPVQDKNPIILELVGNSLGRDITGLQRVLLSISGSPIGELMLGGQASSVSGIAFSATMAQLGVDHLVLDLPDAISPKDLGLGDDPRDLGIHLSGMEQIKTGTRSFHFDRTADATLRLPTILPLQPGVLRISGSTGLPEDARFHVSGSRLLMGPTLLAEGGWECCLRLSAEQVSDAALVLSLLGGTALLDAEAVIDRLEIWPEIGAAAMPSADVRLLFSAPGPRMDEASPPDLRPWMSLDRARVLDILANLPLPLPFVTETNAQTADLNYLTEGWSAPEAVHTWSQEPTAKLSPGGALPKGDFLLRLQSGSLTSPAHPIQRIAVSVGGLRVATILDAAGVTRTRVLGFTNDAPGQSEITFEMPDAVTPLALGLSADERLLGLRLQQIMLDRTDHSRPAAAEGLPLCTLLTDDALQGPEAAWSLQAVPTAATGLLLAISGEGDPPFGLSLGESDVVVHPARIPSPDGSSSGWRALLAIPDTGLADQSALQTPLDIWLHAPDSDGRLDPLSRRHGAAVVLSNA